MMEGGDVLRVTGGASLNGGWRSLDQVGSDDLERAALVVVDGAAAGLRKVLSDIHRRDPAVQMVVVAPAAERAAAERTLLFTPGLGEVWLAAPDELDESYLARAARVTGQRRRYRVTQRRVRADLGDLSAPAEARALVSDRFLAALLEVLPDLVIAVDAEERVISVNATAERMLGRGESELEGRPLIEVFPEADTAELGRLLREGATAHAAGEVEFRRADGRTLTAELSVAPVDAGPEGVRCVVVHDVTEERRIRGELERQAQVLEEQASFLEEQTAEYEMVNQELQERTGELEEAMETRSRFYAGMSHELRTPLNAIIGYNSLLLDGVLGEIPDFVAEHLQRSQHASRHLLELVNDVLDLAKIEAGRIELQVEPVELTGLIAQLFDTVQPLAEQQGTQIELEGPEELSVETDPRRVGQVLLNLISNALKYGGGSPVRVAWSEEGEEIRIAVSDRGPGLAPAQVERIFDEFVQFDHSGGGTGLGLTISRRLAEVLRGRLEVESEVGRGSTFSLVLPRG
jgi:PAS domain S-box-containing protein